ncbi:MAG: histidine kinase [Chitinophagaceae bacterium]
MKKFLKYIFPVLYGLLIYTTIRLFTDAESDRQFWNRPWKLNVEEVGFTILLGYFSIWRHRRLFAWFDKHWANDFNKQRVLKELGCVVLLNIVIQNLLVVPFVALTDDGLQLIDFICVNIVPMFFSLIYYGIVRSNQFLTAYIDGKLQLEKISNDQLQTELKFLKAQYHPHFLFNALNTIYFQMDENVEAAKATVEKFSELLRYQLYDQQQTVPISQEIQYLRNFTGLQSLRTSKRLQLQEVYDPALNGEHVYPLLFISLVENAFKYVGGDYRISIVLRRDHQGLYFKVENSVAADIPFEKKGGIGLENLKRRLQLLYPGKHEFKILQEENSFLAELKLNIIS